MGRVSRSRRGRHHEEENLERWLLTYADLITLLLAFFIIMYSMSKIDNERFSKIMGALNGVLGGGSFGVASSEDVVAPLGKTSNAGTDRQTAALLEEVQSLLEKHELGSSVRAFADHRGVVMTMGEQVLFDEGRAEIKTSAQRILDGVASILIEIPNEIRIEGHTDNVPIHNERFASNWELSVARSTSVIRYLLEQHRVPPEKLSAAGYGEYRPIRPNDTVENRAMNRRVDIVLVPRTYATVRNVEGGGHSG